MFYFTCNESKIYESFTFWNNLQEKNELFHDILIYWDAPVCDIKMYNIHRISYFCKTNGVQKLSDKVSLLFEPSLNNSNVLLLFLLIFYNQTHFIIYNNLSIYLFIYIQYIITHKHIQCLGRMWINKWIHFICMWTQIIYVLYIIAFVT